MTTNGVTVTPLASVDDFVGFGSNQELVQDGKRWSPSRLETLMLQATDAIQDRCQRRLAPFTAKVESHDAFGISPDEYGGDQGGMPLDITGALGWSQAAALGVSDMVRKFWLDENPPMFQELWTYDIASIELLRTFGDTQTFTASDFALLQGPEFDTGEIRMQIGTYCPIGTTIRVTYGGGYTLGLPYSLNMACILQAMKYVLLGNEPYGREGMSMTGLDQELVMLLGPYAKM
jgi:hypothetical protein